jgi:predicted porin
MRAKNVLNRLSLAIGVVGAFATGGNIWAATPEDQRVKAEAATPRSELSVSSNASLGIGYRSPASGDFSLGAPLVGRRNFGGLGVANSRDVSARFSTHLFGGDVGVFGGYADRPSTLSLSPASSWNFGATVGYAGVYVLGGVSDSAAFGPFLGREGWAAGLGYDMGSFNLRLTYAAEATSFAALDRQSDTQRITLGGIYSISPRFSLNADAFYSGRERGLLYLSAPNAKAPPGTGARVGIELRF